MSPALRADQRVDAIDIFDLNTVRGSDFDAIALYPDLDPCAGERCRTSLTSHK